MIETIVGRERDGLFAGRNSGVPIIEFELGAAKKIVGLRSRGSLDLLLEGLDGLVHTAGGKKLLRCVGCSGDREGQQEHGSDKEANQTRRYKNSPLLRKRNEAPDATSLHPLHGLLNHLHASAVGQGLGVGCGQGYERMLAKASGDLHFGEVLQGYFYVAALEKSVDHLIDIGLGVVHAYGFTKQRKHVAVFGGDDGDADIHVRKQTKITGVDRAGHVTHIARTMKFDGGWNG